MKAIKLESFQDEDTLTNCYRMLIINIDDEKTGALSISDMYEADSLAVLAGFFETRHQDCAYALVPKELHNPETGLKLGYNYFDHGDAISPFEVAECVMN